MTRREHPGDRKSLLERVSEETARRDATAAMRLPQAHIAVIDSSANALGINRSEMIRRIVAEWAVRTVSNDEFTFAGNNLVVISLGELEDLRAESRMGIDANQEMWRIGEIVKKYFGEDGKDG